jgi:hypothetical protein
VVFPFGQIMTDYYSVLHTSCEDYNSILVDLPLAVLIVVLNFDIRLFVGSR